MMTDLWDLVALERAAIARDLADLTPQQWTVVSLCPAWTVRDVLAHMTTAGSITPPTFFVRFASAGFNFQKYAQREIDRHLGPDPEATLARFRQIQHSRSSPPGPKPTWVGEVVVHSEDIRRPLTIPHAYEPTAVRVAADFFRGSNILIGAKNRIAGLTLKATDQNWRTGEGPTVEGPLLSLVMAMTGRSAHLADLAGDGLETLRARTP